MFKSLKGKLLVLFGSLVLIIAAIGITSIANIFQLEKSINLMMSDNYKSINAAANMLQAMENQNIATFEYINFQSENSIDAFNKNSEDFEKWYNIESSNFTEKGEKELALKIHQNYSTYKNLFLNIRETRNSPSMYNSMTYYNNNLIPVFNETRDNLQKLSLLNQNALYHTKSKLVMKAHSYMITVILILAVSLAIGMILTIYFINKLLRPLASLTEAVKSVESGKPFKQVKITNNDEIGKLSVEFNQMTDRLQEFEHSSKGKFLAEKNKLSAVVQSLTDPLLVLDNSFNIILMNDACNRILKLDEKTSINNNLVQILPAKELFHFVKDAYESEKESAAMIFPYTLDGKQLFFNVIVSSVKSETSSRSGLVLFFQNITELKHVEKMKADFISTISHEFKTPLTSIMMGASLIEDDNMGGLNQKQHEIVDTIMEDGEKLASLVTNLLQLSKIEWDKSMFSLRPCTMYGLVESCIRNFLDQARDNDVTLTFDVDDELPKVNADPEKIRWVLNNLISNALKFTNAGDDITVTSEIVKGMMEVKVMDTGVGIPREYIEKIFDKFLQVPGSDYEVRGTGLGLTIAKEIVEAHGGRIWCASDLDVGSTFTFTLPLCKSESEV